MPNVSLDSPLSWSQYDGLPHAVILYALRVFSVWSIATVNIRSFNHAFVNIDTAPLIVTNSVLSTLCKSLPMNRNAERFHECFLDVVSCQVTFWSMTSLNATHVTLYSVLRVQNFMFQTMLILTEVTEFKLRVCSTPFLRQTMSKTKWKLTLEIGRFRFLEKTQLNFSVGPTGRL